MLVNKLIFFQDKLIKLLKKNIYNIIILYIYFSFSIYFQIKNICECVKLNSYSDIILTIQGKDTQRILNNESFNLYDPFNDENKDYIFETKPSEIYINDVKVNYRDFYVYDLEKETNEIRIRFEEKLKNCNVMFRGLENIIKIRFENFDTSELTSIDYIFSECTNILSIDLSNFDTSSITNMYKLFYYCNNLISLDLTNFKTSNVKYMNYMFYSCTSLTSLDLSSFDTSSVIDMENMFSQCNKLIILDLSNFVTNSVTKMGSMFKGCTNLISLDISNFDTSNVVNMNAMFRNCNNLISVDFSKFNTNKVYNLLQILYYCNSTMVYCIISSNSNTNSLLSYISTSEYCECQNNNDCSHICFDDNKKIIIETKTCVYNCSDPYIYEYKRICYKACPEGTSPNSNNMCIKDITEISGNSDFSSIIYDIPTTNIINDDISSNSYYIPTSTNIDSDISSNSYDSLTSNIMNSEEFSDDIFDSKTIIPSTINNIKEEILKESDIITSNIIETTEAKFNENIISTGIYNIGKTDYSNNNDELSSIDISSISDYLSNTIKSNSNIILSDLNEYFDNSNTIILEDNLNYIEKYNFNEYFSYVIDIKNTSDIVIYIQNQLKEGNLDKYIIDLIEKQHKDLIFKEKNKNIICTLTSTYNQQNNKNNNISTINLGVCESKLKNQYKINNDKSLLILKAEIYEEGFLIPIIEYEVYNFKKKLNLDICRDIKIEINIPVLIDENNIFKYNSSHEYYNDNCYPYTTENKTDIIIDDRRNEFLNNNMSLCEKNCSYDEYSIDSKKVSCGCYIKIKFPMISEITIDKDKLLNNFIDLKKSTNIKVMKCYKQLFNIDGLLYNIGHYIISSFVLITILLSISFKIKGYNLLKIKIDNIIKNKKELSTINNIKKCKKSKKGKKGKKGKDKINESNKKFDKEKQIKKTDMPINQIKKYKKIKKIKKPIKSLKKRKKSNKININIMKTSDNINKKNSTKLLLNNSINMIGNQNININIINDKFQSDNTKLNNIIRLNDYELNNLSYPEALKFDKRGYFQYYFSLLKTKHLLIFTFYTNSDYNSKIIKIVLFLFSFSLYFTVNALFFNDNTMHQIYEDEGNFNIIYQIPQIFYSTFITSIINIVIKYFSLSEKNILELKNEKTNIKKKKDILLKLLLFKFITFFILIFLFLFLFWYYLSCFCSVYQNTQIHLIKDTLISFTLSLLYPLGLNLLPGILRIPSLKNKNRKTMYEISKLIQLI